MRKNIKTILGSVAIIVGALFIVTNATAIENNYYLYLMKETS